MAFAALASFVASCGVVGPNYQRPVMALDEQFALEQNASLRAAADDAWWGTLSDPTLNHLMQRALAQNLDVQAAVTRINQAQAQLRATGLSAQLSGDAGANARATWTDGQYTDSAQASLAPVFVLDLFGQNRRAQEAAAAGVDTAVFQTAAARLALQLELVTTYLDLRYFQELEVLRNRAVRNQLGVVDAVKQREALSAESRLTLRRAEAELQLQRALRPQSKQGQNAAILRIATLLAEPVGPLMQELSHRRGQPRPSPNIATGRPAELLKNRPDVRAAEAALRTAVARVGVSEAALYPSISLNGTVTVASGVDTVSLGPALSFPVFDRRSRLSAYELALGRANEAELIWRDTVLRSVEEVQVNLSLLQTSDQQVRSLVGAVSKFREAAQLSRDAFRLQAITHVEILDAEESLTQTELRLIDARRAYGRAWAQLNVAIGQGWRAYATRTDKTEAE